MQKEPSDSFNALVLLLAFLTLCYIQQCLQVGDSRAYELLEQNKRLQMQLLQTQRLLEQLQASQARLDEQSDKREAQRAAERKAQHRPSEAQDTPLQTSGGLFPKEPE